MLFNILNVIAAPGDCFCFENWEKTIQLVAYHIKRQLSKTHYFARAKALGSLASNHLIENAQSSNWSLFRDHTADDNKSIYHGVRRIFVPKKVDYISTKIDHLSDGVCLPVCLRKTKPCVSLLNTSWVKSWIPGILYITEILKFWPERRRNSATSVLTYKTVFFQ